MSQSGPLVIHPTSCDCPSCRHIPSRLYPAPQALTLGPGERASRLLRGTLLNVGLHNHPTRLSLRWVTQGRYTYEIQGRRYVLTPGNVLITEDGATYNSISTTGVRTESLSVTFHRTMVLDVLQNSRASQERLLDQNGHIIQSQEVTFFTHTFPVTGPLTQILLRFQCLTQGEQPAGMNFHTLFFEAMSEMIIHEGKARREMLAIPSVKAATREELYRRLNLAREHIHANQAEELNLETIAAQAYLSPFHFLRLFKQAFGMTPHQYVLELRLEKARQVLHNRRNDVPLARLALDCGFNEVSSFTKAYKRRFGVLPSQDRPGSRTQLDV